MSVHNSKESKKARRLYRAEQKTSGTSIPYSGVQFNRKDIKGLLYLKSKNLLPLDKRLDISTLTAKPTETNS